MKLKITVHGVAYEVEVEVLDEGEGFTPIYNFGSIPSYVPPVEGESAASAPAMAGTRQPPESRKSMREGGGSSLYSPVAGTVLDIMCRAGDKVEKGQAILVIEAMKMHTSIASDVDGTVKKVSVSLDDAVREGQLLVEFE